ncbi:uncharacterized protein MYCGRDRAFT_105254 [Zymoseptoria tritici IPO323]|uniref:Uncharacterized protein n=1 Tax=Zymoseptoria tritici (strain CBS 115943 / IPO323) TaxID=336722 RepID=F9XG48_ZYMTI|nr:uncharacterized protein MYCGRDRAFT_105254 [Zymoseptoria tritici IPO323]EGP86063.1 hypothetical protein MYCGRDRAFT_105254 [Zymoseptoria tritici IPO323]
MKIHERGSIAVTCQFHRESTTVPAYNETSINALSQAQQASSVDTAVLEPWNKALQVQRTITRA